MLFRILFDITLLIGLFVFPWWLSALVVLFGLFYFPYFYEAIGAGVVLDGLYAQPVGTFGGFQLVFTLGAVLSVIIVAFLKTKIRLYE